MVSHRTQSGEIRFSSRDLPERDRLAILRESVGRKVTNTDITPLSDRFQAELSLHMMPGVRLMRGTNTPHRFEGPFEASRADDDLILLWMDAPGEMLWKQRAGELVLRDGLATFMTSSDRRVGENSADVSYTTLKVTRSLLKPLVVDPDAALMTPIAADCEPLRLLKHYVEGVRQPMSEQLQTIVATHICDLFALTLGTTQDGCALASGRGLRAARLTAARKLVRQNLAHHGYSVNDAALELGLSPRYLQMLFKDVGTTFSGAMLAERLALVHRQLQNPSFAGLSISTMAYDAGFGDLSHFNHAFRRTYGASPSDIRHQAANLH
jgi:AraC-like DNA-binding protein